MQIHPSRRGRFSDSVFLIGWANYYFYWLKNKDIENLRKCEVGSHNCDHICSDKKYGFECSCYEGFELSSATPNRGKCEDVNECNAGETICAEHEFCSNLVGSYECICKDGFKKDVLKAIGSSNFIGCVDIDECKKNPCAVNEICSNKGTFNDLCLTPINLNYVSVGSYNCGCESGYQKGTGTTCVDINECADDPCVENEVCINNLGSYICMCEEGYQKEWNNFQIDPFQNDPFVFHGILMIFFNDFRKGFDRFML